MEGEFNVREHAHKHKNGDEIRAKIVRTSDQREIDSLFRQLWAGSKSSALPLLPSSNLAPAALSLPVPSPDPPLSDVACESVNYLDISILDAECECNGCIDCY